MFNTEELCFGRSAAATPFTPLQSHVNCVLQKYDRCSSLPALILSSRCVQQQKPCLPCQPPVMALPKIQQSIKRKVRVRTSFLQFQHPPELLSASTIIPPTSKRTSGNTHSAKSTADGTTEVHFCQSHQLISDLRSTIMYCSGLVH